jgi:general secretion pathway protein I
LFRLSNIVDAARAGFTMIEALVTLAVIAIVLTAIGLVVSANIRGTQMVAERLTLIETGRALLTALPGRNELAAGDTTGELANNRWRLDVLPFSADFVDTSQPTPWVPQTVVLRLQSPNGEILRIDTVRLRRSDGSAQ